MSPLPEMKIAPAIAAQQAVVTEAKSRLAEIVTDIQARCEHRIVSEAPWKKLEYFPSMNAIRICNHCRLEEEGSHWSGGSTWSRHDYGKSELGNLDGRIVLPVGRDELYAMRVQ